jgi:hypothetical protein
MNERIKELWSQAGGHYNSGNQHTWPEYTIDDPEKFAELIVRECLTVINQPNGVGDDDVIRISDDVKRHFGVEEQ